MLIMAAEVEVQQATSKAGDKPTRNNASDTATLAPSSCVKQVSHPEPGKVNGRIRSASVGRDKKHDLQCRYWGLLFDSLRRAVDELYRTCELEENIDACKEVVLVLETYTRDFRSLIEWLQLQWNYEHTPPKQRPTSFAWEVRKTSPLKPFPWLLADKKRLSLGPARRLVSYEEGQLPPLPPSVMQKLLVSEKRAIPDNTVDQITNQMTSVSNNHENKKTDKATYSSATQRTVKKSPLPIKKKESVISDKNIPKAPLKRPATAAASTSKHIPPRPPVRRPMSASNQPPPQPGPPGSAKIVVASMQPNTSNSPKPPMTSIAEDDDNDGWETVRGRTRSRTSPAKVLMQSGRPALTRSATNISLPSRASNFRDQDRRGSHPYALSFRGSNSSLTNGNQSKGQLFKPKHATSLPTLLVTTKETKMAPINKKNIPSPVVPKKDDKAKNLLKKTEKKAAPKVPDNRSPQKKDVSCNIHVPSEEPVANGQPSDSDPLSMAPTNVERSTQLLKATDESDCVKENAALGGNEDAADTPIEVKIPVNVVVEDSDSRDVESLADEAEMAEKEAALRSAMEEEQSLEEEVRQTEADMALHDGRSMEEQQEEWDFELEGMGSGSGSDSEALPKWAQSLSPSTLSMLEAQCSSVSWADEMDLLDQLGAVESRTPGRLLQVHEKLSSPSRKRSVGPDETYRLHEAKQAKAELLRAKYLTTKVVKRKELLNKISEVRAAKDQLLQEKRDLLDRKLVRASEKRKQHLADIVKKAHDEDEKLKEIAFINELEAQNKRHDLMTQVQTQEERLQGLQEERLRRRQEERAAREAAIEERKKQLASEREAKLAVLQEKRRIRQERIERELQEKEKERLETAREKQRDREERLSALQAAHVATLEAMQKKLQQKQEECARRHEETIGQIRQKALESSTLKYGGIGDEPPKLVPYESPKFCNACNCALRSDLEVHAHLVGRSHAERVKKKTSSGMATDSELITNLPDGTVLPNGENQRRERQKGLKKRAKKVMAKIKQKMDAYQFPIASNTLPASPARSRLQKVLRDLERQTNALATERAVGELYRMVSNSSTDKLPGKSVDRGLLGQMGAPKLLVSLMVAQLTGHTSAKLSNSVCKTLVLLCKDHAQNTTQIVMNPGLSTMVDWLQNRLETVKTDLSQGSFALCGILQVLECVFDTAHRLETTDPAAFTSDTKAQIQELSQYLVCLGILDSLSTCFASVRPGMEDENCAFSLVQSGLGMLSSAVLLSAESIGPERTAKTKKPTSANEPWSFLTAVEVSEMFQIVTMLYSLVVLPGGPLRCIAKMSTPPPKLPEGDAKLVIRGLETLAVIAVTLPVLFQTRLNKDAPSLKWRYVVNYLLAYVQNEMYSPLAVPLLRCVAYYAAGHSDNQLSLNGAGIGLPIIQQLCCLPFRFFSDPNLQGALFSCLLACCEGFEANKEIVRQEMAYQMLEDYLASETGKRDPLLIFMGCKA